LWVSKRQPRQEGVKPAQAVVYQAAQPGHHMKPDQAIVSLIPMNDQKAFSGWRFMNIGVQMFCGKGGIGRYA